MLSPASSSSSSISSKPIHKRPSTSTLPSLLPSLCPCFPPHITLPSPPLPRSPSPPSPHSIFKKTLSQILENLENYLLTTYDTIGILLIIKVTPAHPPDLISPTGDSLAASCDATKAHSSPGLFLRSHLHAPLAAIQICFRCQSQKSSERQFSEIRGHRVDSALRLSVHSTLLSCFCDLSVSHVRRYAEFVSSVLALTRGSDSFGVGGGGETMLLTDLQQIRVEIIGTSPPRLHLRTSSDALAGLLERLGSQLPTSKERKVFIINNVDQVTVPH
jgi:hypothetical protein